MKFVVVKPLCVGGRKAGGGKSEPPPLLGLGLCSASCTQLLSVYLRAYVKKCTQSANGQNEREIGHRRADGQFPYRTALAV